MSTSSQPVPWDACPDCGRPYALATQITAEPAPPAPGDALCCFSCAFIAVVGPDGRAERPSYPEWPDGDPSYNPRDVATLRRAQAMIRARGRLPWPARGGEA